MKKSNNKISTAVVPFFPTSHSTHAKRTLKRYFWPVILSLALAVLFGVCAYMLTGGVLIPGAPYLSPFKAALSLTLKRVVLAAVTVGTFLAIFVFAKWYGFTKPKPQPYHVTLLQNETRPLPHPLRISNLHGACITHYNANEDECTIQTNCYTNGFETQKSAVFIPLQTRVNFEDESQKKSATVTHYREQDQLFLVYYPEQNREEPLTQEDINRRSSLSSRRESSFVGRPTRDFIQPEGRSTSLKEPNPQSTHPRRLSNAQVRA